MMLLWLFLAPSIDLKCGPTLKEKALYPQKLAEVSTLAAQNLEGHAKWVEAGKSKPGKAEADLLRQLAKDHRDVAAALERLRKDLDKAGSLAPAPHDLDAIDPNLAKGFAQQAVLERSVAQQLTGDANAIEQMLAQLPKKK
jgi:hypothetical protein